MKRLKKMKGQELVEFALILPIMILILVAIAELGFVWTLRGTVGDAVKSSVQQMQLIAGLSPAQAQGVLQTNIKNYIVNHGLPNADSVQVTLSDPNASEHTVVSVQYQYNPSFTLPNFFGVQILPDTFTLTSTQVINSAVIQPNNFSAGDPNLPSAVNPASPNSILIDDPTSGEFIRKQMAFIVDLPGDVDKIVNWWGHDIFPGSVGINTKTGTLMVKSPYSTDMYGGSVGSANGFGWKDTGQSYSGLLLANGYTTVFYVDGSAGLNIDGVEMTGIANVYEGELGTGLSWCTPASGGGTNTCDGDLTTNGAANTTLTNGIYEIGKGYEVLVPVPTASVIDAVSLPSAADVADLISRGVSYDQYNFPTVKFYSPKDVTPAEFIVPAEVTDNLADAATREKYLYQVIDADGDGIPTYWDLHPEDGDVDKDLVLDGYQSSLSGPVKANYDIYSWGPIDGKTAVFPQNNVVVPSATPAINTLVDYVHADFAPSSCATAGCTTNQPFFLRVFNDYRTGTGERVEIATSGTNSSFYNSEKYREPDPNKNVYIFNIHARDANEDNTVTISGTIGPLDDDINDDGIYNYTDSLPLSDGTTITKGLMYIDSATGGFIAQNKFASVTNFLKNGYTAINPATDLVSPEVKVLDPSRKASH